MKCEKSFITSGDPLLFKCAASKPQIIAGHTIPAMRTNLLLVAAVVVCAVAATPTTATKVGVWEPITDINDPFVQELGGWAVAEHVKEANDGLKLSKVVSGDQKVGSGMNYRLVIHALGRDGKGASYKALVYDQEWSNTRRLLSFAPAN
ncbi:cysteine proteinase inhibitor 8-like [Panicum virgatum]|uniref:Cystatin domain-containing protein n=1 Tax=Panicum virgatum TaxID=38727 RepID=A0A8T0RC70_PANVG|nr:cysteine proteinase inhibitor 8-like [Panicum virgatum]KAG2582718.1 hypothetical protein PVAP13_6KG177600 [Panicum virgatum]